MRRDVLHCLQMIQYEAAISKAVLKGKIPKNIFVHFNNVFIALDKTKDLKLFDIKKLKSSLKRNYYRLRKGKYRAIFYLEKDNIFVIALDKREDVYKRWE